MQEQVATKADLVALNRYTLRELKEDEVFIFAAKFIGIEPTSNGRIWSKEWMEASIERKLWQGVPFMTDHANSLSMKIGTIYSATLEEDGIHGKVFIPLDEQGKQSKEAIENSRIRSVSINADGESLQEGDITRILPADDMRIFEVSAVQVAGCKTCVITEETQGGVCESDNMMTFAKEQLEELQAEFVKLIGFTLGISINRETYKKVAESIDPLTLRRVSKDLREAYVKKEHENKCDSQVDGDSHDHQRIADQMDHLKLMKGA